MFDFSFTELMLIMVVALVVIGPQRLPKVARTMGHLWGRAQRYMNNIKSDIARDMDVEEFRQLQKTLQEEASSVGESVKQMTMSVDEQLQKINETVAKYDKPGSGLETSPQGTPEQLPEAAPELPQQPLPTTPIPVAEHTNLSGTPPERNPK